MITKPKRTNPFPGFRATSAVDARGRIHGLVTWQGKTVTVCHHRTELEWIWKFADYNPDDFRREVRRIRQSQLAMSVGYVYGEVHTLHWTGPWGQGEHGYNNVAASLTDVHRKWTDIKRRNPGHGAVHSFSFGRSEKLRLTHEWFESTPEWTPLFGACLEDTLNPSPDNQSYSTHFTTWCEAYPADCARVTSAVRLWDNLRQSMPPID